MVLFDDDDVEELRERVVEEQEQKQSLPPDQFEDDSDEQTAGGGGQTGTDVSDSTDQVGDGGEPGPNESRMSEPPEDDSQHIVIDSDDDYTSSGGSSGGGSGGGGGGDPGDGGEPGPNDSRQSEPPSGSNSDGPTDTEQAARNLEQTEEYLTSLPEDNTDQSTPLHGYEVGPGGERVAPGRDEALKRVNRAQDALRTINNPSKRSDKYRYTPEDRLDDLQEQEQRGELTSTERLEMSRLEMAVGSETPASVRVLEGTAESITAGGRAAFAAFGAGVADLVGDEEAKEMLSEQATRNIGVANVRAFKVSDSLADFLPTEDVGAAVGQEAAFQRAENIAVEEGVGDLLSLGTTAPAVAFRFIDEPVETGKAAGAGLKQIADTFSDNPKELQNEIIGETAGLLIGGGAVSARPDFSPKVRERVVMQLDEGETVQGRITRPTDSGLDVTAPVDVPKGTGEAAEVQAVRGPVAEIGRRLGLPDMFFEQDVRQTAREAEGGRGIPAGDVVHETTVKERLNRGRSRKGGLGGVPRVEDPAVEQPDPAPSLDIQPDETVREDMKTGAVQGREMAAAVGQDVDTLQSPEQEFFPELEQEAAADVQTDTTPALRIQPETVVETEQDLEPVPAIQIEPTPTTNTGTPRPRLPGFGEDAPPAALNAVEDETSAGETEFAPSLDAVLFDIEAEEGFDEEQVFTGLETRPVTDDFEPPF